MINQRMRELYCKYCKIYSESDICDDHCLLCGHRLITVIVFLDGSKTGNKNDELGSISSGPTLRT